MRNTRRMPQWAASEALCQSGLDRAALRRLRRNFPRRDVNTLTPAEIAAWKERDAALRLEICSVRLLYAEKSEAF
jgi:hypothetical protein